MRNLSGKVAWITGGGSGIGLAGALELAKAGAHVVISGRTASTNEKALFELKKSGSAGCTLRDVPEKRMVGPPADHIAKRHGRINSLGNSFGGNSSVDERIFATMTTE